MWVNLFPIGVLLSLITLSICPLVTNVPNFMLQLIPLSVALLYLILGIIKDKDTLTSRERDRERQYEILVELFIKRWHEYKIMNHVTTSRQIDFTFVFLKNTRNIKNFIKIKVACQVLLFSFHFLISY